MKNIYKYFTGLILILLFTVSCSSPRNIIRQIPSTCMWKVSKDSATVYLLGSIHMARENLYPLDEQIENAFADSDYLVVEIDTKNNQPDPMAMMAKMTFQDPAKSLKSELSEKTYKMIKEKLDALNMPEMVYSRLKPWAAMLLIMTTDLTGDGYQAQLGIDNYFLEKAGDDKKILELETIDFQMEMLESLDDMSDEYIEYSMKEMETSNQSVDEMSNLWETGNCNELVDLINQPAEDFPEHKTLMDKILNDRNKKMAVKISDYLKTGNTYFVVVGAGHLGGSGGIVELLKKTDD